MSDTKVCTMVPATLSSRFTLYPVETLVTWQFLGIFQLKKYFHLIISRGLINFKHDQDRKKNITCVIR